MSPLCNYTRHSISFFVTFTALSRHYLVVFLFLHSPRSKWDPQLMLYCLMSSASLFPSVLKSSGMALKTWYRILDTR